MSNEQRKPLLSDEDIDKMLEWTGDSERRQMENVRDRYERMITHGLLFTKAQVIDLLNNKEAQERHRQPKRS